jgi:hypothetical protein
MQEKTHTHAKGATTSSFSARSSLFPPRAFGQRERMNEPESKNSQARPASRGALGHRFGAISVTNGPPVVVQAKLKLGPANDKFEQEADRVAGRVAGSLTAADVGDSRRPAPGGAAWEKPAIQRLSADAATANLPTVDPWTASTIQQARGGRPLSAGVRAPIEKSLGTDFSGVRVHTDAVADAVNSHLEARAFTTGQHIFFKRGAYEPAAGSGKWLLAHELTHVLQQATLGTAAPTNSILAGHSTPLVQRAKTKGVTKKFFGLGPQHPAYGKSEEVEDVREHHIELLNCFDAFFDPKGLSYLKKEWKDEGTPYRMWNDFGGYTEALPTLEQIHNARMRAAGDYSYYANPENERSLSLAKREAYVKRLKTHVEGLEKWASALGLQYPGDPVKSRYWATIRDTTLADASYRGREVKDVKGKRSYKDWLKKASKRDLERRRFGEGEGYDAGSEPSTYERDPLSMPERDDRGRWTTAGKIRKRRRREKERKRRDRRGSSSSSSSEASSS